MKNIRYWIALALIALGLTIMVPAFLEWVASIFSFICADNPAIALENARTVFSKIIVGVLITSIGIGLLVWNSLIADRREPKTDFRFENISDSPIVLAIDNINTIGLLLMFSKRKSYRFRTLAIVLSF